MILTSNHRNRRDNVVSGDRFISHPNFEGLLRFAASSPRLLQWETILVSASTQSCWITHERLH